MDLFLSFCSSELIPELTFGTCSEISALQVCLGSPQRLLSCARWCRSNLWIVSGLVVTPHPQSSSAFCLWGHVTVVSRSLESPKQQLMDIKQHTLEKTVWADGVGILGLFPVLRGQGEALCHWVPGEMWPGSSSGRAHSHALSKTEQVFMTLFSQVVVLYTVSTACCEFPDKKPRG